MQKVGQKWSGYGFRIWTRTHLSLRRNIEDPYSCLAVQVSESLSLSCKGVGINEFLVRRCVRAEAQAIARLNIWTPPRTSGKPPGAALPPLPPSTVTDQYAIQLTIVAFQRFYIKNVKTALNFHENHDKKLCVFIRRMQTMQTVGQKCFRYGFEIWNCIYCRLETL